MCTLWQVSFFQPFLLRNIEKILEIFINIEKYVEECVPLLGRFLSFKLLKFFILNYLCFLLSILSKLIKVFQGALVQEQWKKL